MSDFFDDLTEEEIAAFVLALYEVHLTDNKDGTVTMVYKFETPDGEALEVPMVFQFTLAEWFGELFKGGVAFNDQLQQWGETGVAIPSNAEDL